MRVEIVRRHDVEHAGVRHRVGVIERHPVRDASAAIVADDGELVEAEVLHHLDLIEGHRALRVVGVVLAVRRLAAVAVSAEIGHDHGVLGGELRRHESPRDVGLRRAVQQQDRRPDPPMTPVISAPLVFTLNDLKPGKKRVVSLTVCASSVRPAPAATPIAATVRSRVSSIEWFHGGK